MSTYVSHRPRPLLVHHNQERDLHHCRWKSLPFFRFGSNDKRCVFSNLASLDALPDGLQMHLSRSSSIVRVINEGKLYLLREELVLEAFYSGVRSNRGNTVYII